MKIKAALFYNGSIAFYNVYLIDHCFFKAKLDYYRGEVSPPVLVELYKKGQIWSSDCAEQEIIKELCGAIAQNQDAFYQKAS